MPTGYTAKLADGGQSFPDFIWHCARAFGALVMLRDDMAAAIPERFEPSDYNLKQATADRQKLAQLQAMTPAEVERAAGQAWDAAERARTLHLIDKRARRLRYETMLAQVEAWTPPTVEHIGLQEFMQSQLKESIQWDCNESYVIEPEPRQSGADWLATQAGALLESIAYHEKQHAAEVARTESRNAWIDALRKSLSEDLH